MILGKRSMDWIGSKQGDGTPRSHFCLNLTFLVSFSKTMLVSSSVFFMCYDLSSVHFIILLGEKMKNEKQNSHSL